MQLEQIYLWSLQRNNLFVNQKHCVHHNKHVKCVFFLVKYLDDQFLISDRQSINLGMHLTKKNKKYSYGHGCNTKTAPQHY